MKNLRISAAVLALALGLAACGGSSPVSPGGARFDNGSTMGTGHRSADGGVTLSAPGDKTSARNRSTMGTGH